MKQLRLRQILERQRQQSYRPRVFHDRLNPFEAYEDDEFVRRYRFSKNGIHDLCELLRIDLQHDKRGKNNFF